MMEVSDILGILGHALTSGRTNYPQRVANRRRQRDFEDALKSAQMETPEMLARPGITPQKAMINPMQANLLKAAGPQVGMPMLLQAAMGGGAGKRHTLSAGAGLYDDAGNLLAERAANPAGAGAPIVVSTPQGPRYTTREDAIGKAPFFKPDMPDKRDMFKDAGSLRQEYTKVTQEPVKVAQAYGRIKASASNPSPAGDLAMIFNFMKMQDPGSTVREGEFATAQNSGSAYQRGWSLYNQIMQGTRLTDAQRGDFMKRAEKLYVAAKGGFTRQRRRYDALAKRYGFDPDEITYGLDDWVNQGGGADPLGLEQ